MNQDIPQPQSGPKKRVLFFTSPSFFLVTGYRQKSLAQKFLPSGAKLLASSLNPNLFDVDLYDFDSLLRNRFTCIEDCITELPELYYKKELHAYLRGERKNPLLEKLLQTLGDNFEGYDYLLCSNQRNPHYEICVFAGNNLTLIIMQYLARKNPGAQKIYGGRRSHYFDWAELERNKVDISELVDVVVMHPISFQSINGLLLNREVAGSHFWDRTGTYKWVPHPPRMAEPPQDYSRPRNLLRNREDLRHSYKRIFEELHLPLPVKEMGDRYIQQGSLHYIGGCTSKCAFCATGWEPPIFDTIEHIQDTIKLYTQELGYNAFFFENATLNSNKKLVEKLCNWIVRENIKISWSDSCRLSRNGSDFYKMLFEAGARMLCYGFDAGNDKTLQYVRKGTTTKEMETELRYAHEAGIWNLVNFIGGHPFETHQELEDTFNVFHKNLPYINIYKFNVFHVEQRSPFGREPEKFNLRIKELSEEQKIFEGMKAEEIQYEEIGGRNWEETKEFRKHVRSRIRQAAAQNGKSKFTIHIGQHLLFALYDMLGSKPAVEAWLTTNYELGMRSYYEQYKHHPKIEVFDSNYDLYPHFQDKTDNFYVLKGIVENNGHSKLDDNISFAVINDVANPQY